MNLGIDKKNLIGALKSAFAKYKSKPIENIFEQFNQLFEQKIDVLKLV